MVFRFRMVYSDNNINNDNGDNNRLSIQYRLRIYPRHNGNSETCSCYQKHIQYFLYSKQLSLKGVLSMPTATLYCPIRKKKSFKKIEDVLSIQEYEILNRTLREIICQNYRQIIKGVSFTEEEMERLEMVKSRRIFERHYQRFG